MKSNLKLLGRLSLLLILMMGVMPCDIAKADMSQDMSTRNRIKIRKKTKLENVSADDTEEYSLEKIEILGSKRRNLIQDIKRFVRESQSEDQKSELNLRLGALYMEDYHAGMSKANQIYDRELAAYQKELAQAKDKKKFTRKPPKMDNSDAIASLDKARSIYKDLLTRFPNHPRRDEMIYFMAVASLDKGNVDEGMNYFKMLSEKNPKSRYINEALVQLGDYYFERNKWSQAENYFDKIIQKKHIALLPYAYYKKAWCAYNEQKTENALALFKWVIANEDITQGETAAPIRIKQEALKDIALPFTDLKQVDESIAYFKNQGDTVNRRALETMASLYFESGDYPRAITLYEHLLKLDANYVKNPTYDVSIIEALKAKHDENGAIARLFERFPAYVVNSNWYEINVSNTQAIKEASTVFEEIAYKYAVEYHAQAQRTKNEELYALARKLYTKYLDFFPRTARAPKARYQLAEILYKQAKYVDASDQYYRVFKEPAAADLRADAVRNALMSLDRQLNLDRKKSGLAELNNKMTKMLTEKEDASLEPVAFSDVEGKFLKIGDEYLGAYPAAKDAADVLYEMAYLQYTHHEFTDAYKNFWTLAQKYPNHETAYASGHLILDILNRRKDYTRLVAACKKFLSTPALSKPTFRADVADILRHGELKRIQAEEAKGEYKQAGDDYVDYTRNFGPQDEGLFEKALYNAGVNYTKANLYLLAVETQERFLRRFPKSPLREELLLQVAKTYELLAKFDKSAYYYEQFAIQFARNPQAKTAQRLAGLYYWGAGNVAKAEVLMLSYARLYPADAKTSEKDLIDLYESTNSTDKLTRFYLEARAAKGVPASDYVAYSLKIAEIMAKNSGRIPEKVMEEALRTTQVFGKDMLATPKGVDATSKLLFWFANRREQQFYAIKLALPQRQLEINLQRKLVLMKELEKEYGKVAALGSPEWGLGAMYKTALAYRTMASDISNAPVPAELSAEQVDMYRAEIDKTFVKPFNEKAKAMATQCLDKAQEFNLLSSWTSNCYSVASESDPQTYPMVRTFYLPPLQLAVIAPKEGSTKIEVGNFKTYAYPFFSFGLFNPTVEARALASTPIEHSLLYSENRTVSEGPTVVPVSMNYRVLAENRKEILSHALNQERPSDGGKKGYSFSFINLLRLTTPARALPLVLGAIEKDPNSLSLHNLLGLTYLEMGNYPAAKITWLSLVSRGIKNAALWNNLGVLAHLEGREASAIEYFSEATLMDDSKEALTNLGFVALKNRNGFEAKKEFEKAMSMEKNEVTPQVGYAVAQLQNRELDSAKDRLVELTRKYKTDPYARISLAYFMMDVEKEMEVANRLLWDYMDNQQAENDMIFRQATQEVKRRAAGGSAGEELPNLQ